MRASPRRASSPRQTSDSGALAQVERQLATGAAPPSTPAVLAQPTARATEHSILVLCSTQQPESSPVVGESQHI